MPESLHQKMQWLKNILLIMLFGTYIMNVHYVTTVNRQNIKSLNEGRMEQLVNEMDVYSEHMMDLASSLAYSSFAYEYFTMSQVDRVIHNEEAMDACYNVMAVEPDIRQIGLYDKKGSLIAGNSAFWSQKEIKLKWKTGKKGFHDVFQSKENGKLSYVISFPVFNLSSEIYGKRIGTVVLAMRMDGLQDIMEKMQVTEHSLMLLTDAEGNQAVSYGEGSGEKDRKKYYQNEVTVNAEGWRLKSLIPKSAVYAESAGYYMNLTIVYLFLAVLMTGVFYLFQKSVIVPLGKIDDFIQSLNECPQARMETVRKDEIGRMVQSLNHMLDEKDVLQDNIQRAQKKEYEIELSKRKIQMLAYQNQIHPHFLYNTLGCIRAMALCYDADDIAEITMSLSDLFRYAVKGENVVLVSEELDYIREYAKIIQYRFGGKIRIHIHTTGDVEKKPVIKLLLQPLIENAVFHGVERNLDGGDIWITVEPDIGSRIRFCIKDNGCGMSEERIKEVMEKLESEEQKQDRGIGIANIYKRMQLFYGDKAEFVMKSNEREGTCITIIIPDHIQEEKYV